LSGSVQDTVTIVQSQIEISTANENKQTGPTIWAYFCKPFISTQRVVQFTEIVDVQEKPQVGAISQLRYLRPGNVKPNAQLPNLHCLW